MVDFNGFVVLLGTSYEKSVMFQLAKYKGDQFPVRISVHLFEVEIKEWKDLLDISYDSKKGIKEAMEYMEEKKKVVRTTFLGKGCCRFFSLQGRLLAGSCIKL